MDLLAQLRELGCEVYADGNTLRVRDPRRALTDELRQAIRERKAELLEALAVDRPEAPAPPPGPVPAPAPANKPRERHADAAGLVALCRDRGLVHFRTARFPGRELYLARDGETAKSAPAGAVVFTLAELRELAKLPAEHMFPVGAAKVFFGGWIHIELGKEPVIDLGGGTDGLPAVDAAGRTVVAGAGSRRVGAGEHYPAQAVQAAQRAGRTGAGAAISGCTALEARSQVATATAGAAAQGLLPWGPGDSGPVDIRGSGYGGRREV